ncbi:RIC3 acetylcholine receptor chaperone isoform X5 [Andrena cerasifolii]|uniref:RIC3 acetylcholine receptor chaperone isoform X5 n=1 Tax=Andrena cerasifolii TaxID=2819439 RepID=UPI0040382565
MSEITDFGPRKTIFILAIVAGCFAVLWPRIFYPMLTASVTPHHTTDTSACCDVIFESDVTAADIMHEICQNILKHHQVDPRVRDVLKTIKLTPQSASLCREEILARCGIDLSTFLAERERLGKSNKQVLEEIRSFNSSLCLKMHFGIPLSQLGTPHLIRYHILMPHSTIRQERRTPPHAGGLHPALRERGRAIPSTHIVPKVADRPDHVIPKIRPPLGGAGHVVPAPNGNGTMGIIMPLYTLGIVLFFLYTIVKVLKKNSDSEIISEYPGAAAEKEFRKMVFSPEAFATAMTGGTMNYEKERSPSPQMPAPTIEELKDHGPPKSNGPAGVDRSSKDDADAQAEHSKADEEVEIIENSPTVKVMGMEMTASCEGKGSRPTTPIIPVPPSSVEREKTPPKPIYLEGALPPQCELLVTDSETQAQRAEEDSEAPVVLSGKMTLSLISLDQNAAESDEGNQEVRGTGDVTASNMESTGETLDTRQFEDRGQEEIQVRKEIENGTEADEVTGEKEDEKEELEDDEDMEEDEEEIEEEEEEDGVAEDDEEEYEEEEELEEEVEEEVEVEEEEEEEVVEYDGEELEDEEIETGDDKGDEGVEDVVEEEEETSEEEEERGERRLQNVNQILSKKFE